MKCPDCGQEAINLKAHAMNHGHTELLSHILAISPFPGITRESDRILSRGHSPASCHYCAMEQEPPDDPA